MLRRGRGEDGRRQVIPHSLAPGCGFSLEYRRGKVLKGRSRHLVYIVGYKTVSTHFFLTKLRGKKRRCIGVESVGSTVLGVKNFGRFESDITETDTLESSGQPVMMCISSSDVAIKSRRFIPTSQFHRCDGFSITSSGNYRCSLVENAKDTPLELEEQGSLTSGRVTRGRDSRKVSKVSGARPRGCRLRLLRPNDLSGNWTHFSGRGGAGYIILGRDTLRNYGCN